MNECTRLPDCPAESHYMGCYSNAWRLAEAMRLLARVVEWEASNGTQYAWDVDVYPPIRAFMEDTDD